MNLKLGTHQRFESKNSLSAYNTLSLLITMAQNSQKNFELDYTFLLEVSNVKGNVLSFTDDKAKRYEINKRLGRNCRNSYSRLQENNRQGKGAIRQKCRKTSICLMIN